MNRLLVVSSAVLVLGLVFLLLAGLNTALAYVGLACLAGSGVGVLLATTGGLNMILTIYVECPQ